MKRIAVGAKSLAILASTLIGCGTTEPIDNNQAELATDRAATSAMAAIPNDVIRTIAQAEPRALDDLASIHFSADDTLAVSETLAGKIVSVPSDASAFITIRRADGKILGIGIPSSQSASRAVGVSPGIIAYRNLNGSTTAPLLKADGSVEILTIIESNRSPSAYRFPLQVPEGGRLELVDNAWISIRDADNNFVGGISPAWAKDANGDSLPTHYELEGTSLVQVIEHNRGRGVAYPVVADPWIGVDLFSRVTYWTTHGQPAVSAYLSGWGRAIHYGWDPGGGTIGGQAIFRTAGWDELRSKQSVVLTKETFRQQYDCHVTFGFWPLGGDSWDLEKFQANNPNWLLNWWGHHCNWST